MREVVIPDRLTSMLPRGDDIWRFAGPLLCAPAFQRLSQISFLGLLSPRYWTLNGYPLTVRRRSDGSRAEHSFAVAQIALDMTRRVGFSVRAQRYAIAWALVHDLATWPLSHSGEAAFSGSTNTVSGQLRTAMIKGAYALPHHLTVLDALRESDIEPEILLALSGKAGEGLDHEFRLLHSLLHSRITPDTLDGMYRSGAVFGVSVPQPGVLVRSLIRDIFSNVLVDRTRSSQVLSFWRAKARIYDEYINLMRTVEYESAWSRAIEDSYWRYSLPDTLQMTERQVIDGVLVRGVPKFRGIKRYKAPLTYQVASQLWRKRVLSHSVTLNDLNDLLVKNQKPL